ncbi:MAG: hypothetical protein M3O46_02035 [Myxococcota bacterium]|nr:hypothetical protein [Myxococcota bacterium]
MRVVLGILPVFFSLTTPIRALADEQFPAARKAGLLDVFATAFVGDGLRFNNPYRLATLLGRNAQSPSRTASYLDVGAAFALGDPAHAANGIAFRASMALEGVSQSVFAASYLLFRRFSAWAAYARAGIPLVLSPDTTWGFEGAAGGIWFVRAGVGLATELVGDVFYGAGTREVATPAYPVLSAQAGLWLSWEAMP